jgi:probable rRNA maturation factor
MPKSPDITVHVRDARWKAALRPYCKTVEDACAAALGKKRGEIGVVLATDRIMKGLNRDFRGKDRPTNVLSFPGEGGYLGDIILAYETVAREAKAQKKTVKAHTKHLLVHGVLHLLGHDHMDDKEAEAMEQREIKILKKLGVSNPYL